MDVLLHFSIAFDNVVITALDMTLIHFGSGHTYKRWIHVLYPGTRVSLIFNGFSLDTLELKAGYRQGDPGVKRSLYRAFTKIFSCQSLQQRNSMLVFYPYGHYFCRGQYWSSTRPSPHCLFPQLLKQPLFVTRHAV